MPKRRTPEADFQKEVVRLARLFSWRVYYMPDWMYRIIMAAWKRFGDRPGRDWPDKGFPDVVFCKPPRFFLAELKAGKNKTSPEQDDWIRDIRACGIDVYIWREADMDEVIRVLTR